MARNTISLVAKTTLITFLPLLAVVPLRAQNGNGNGQANGIVKGLTTCVLNGKKYDNCTAGMQKQANRQAAAKTRKAKRKAATSAGITLATYDAVKGPDYFGLDPNYANSPVPMGGIGRIVPVFGGTGYSSPTVTITDLYNPQAAGASANAIVQGGVITDFQITGAGSGYMAPVVSIADATGSGANVRVELSGIVSGTGMLKFQDALKIPPLAKGSACASLGYSGTDADCYEIRLIEYTQQMHSGLPATKLRGYVEVVNNAPQTPSYLGPIIVAQRGRPVRVVFKNMLPIGGGGNLFIPVDTTYMGAGGGPGAGMNINCATGPTQTKPAGCYTENRATIHLHGGVTPWISDGTTHQWITPTNETTAFPKGVSVKNVPDMGTGCDAAGSGCQTFYYTNQQSARLMFYHDHAMGMTRLNVYAGEAAGYVVQDSSEQSLFGPSAAIPNTILMTAPNGQPVLDNSIGIPLVIQDRSFVPSLNQLNAQDPSWKDIPGMLLPESTASNGNGGLYWPHVYMPNQNPYATSGANAMGRWDYGPWFWPPFTGLIHGAVPNPYCLPTPGVDCSNSPDEPPFKPGTPNPSGTPESFMDTMVVNGTAYPTLTVPAAPVRFRILNGSNDRFLNLSLFVAADKSKPTTAGGGAPVICNGTTQVPVSNCTEVAMVPFNSAQNAITPFPSWWYTYISGGFTFDDRSGGVPDPRYRGPAMVQIGTEGGLLPAPVVIKNQPVNYVYNRRDITVGNVNEKALFMGPAERADVIVDFGKFAGKTLILYNDSPAPVPAADPRLDYYTGDPDNTDTGGAPSTQAGYGPNTRTVMQIVVQGNAATPDIAVDDVNTAIWTALAPCPSGVTTNCGALPAAFAASQDKIIVPQTSYKAVYPTDPSPNLTTDVAGGNLSTIQANSLTFAPLGQTTALTFPMEPKAIIEDFTIDYGRMNALLGVEIKNTNVTNQTSIPQGYGDPPTELVKVSDPTMTAIGGLNDGTQIWKITHNGVDTHPVHFHMFSVQVLNRVGWDGAIRPPDPNELGFKDTVRMNPLEDIIVALRPIGLKDLPFTVPNSSRPLAPTASLGATTSATGAPLFTNVDPQGNPVTITNQLANFGWEYVWHCHILGHEENDFMRALVVAVPPAAPTNLVVALLSNGNMKLTWANASPGLTTGFTVQRAADQFFQIGLSTFRLVGNVSTFTDTTVQKGQVYFYRIFANNTVGSTVPGYPTLTADSGFSNVVTSGAAVPADPSGLTASLQAGPQVRLTWNDNAINETGFIIERAVNGGTFAQLTTVPARNNTGSVTFTDTSVAGAVGAGNSYLYRVKAVNLAGSSNYATATPIILALPAAPSLVVATAAVAGNNSATVTLTWQDNATNETGFTIQRATNNTFTTGLSSTNVGANVQTLTQNVSRGTAYYYRIRSNNLAGSSGWVNAAPLPITTP